MFGIRSQVWQKRNPAKRRKLLLDLDGFEVHEDLWSLYIAPGLKKSWWGWRWRRKTTWHEKTKWGTTKTRRILKNNWVVGIDLMSQINLMTQFTCFFLTVIFGSPNSDGFIENNVPSYGAYVRPMTDEILEWFHSGNSWFLDYASLLNGVST